MKPEDLKMTWKKTGSSGRVAHTCYSHADSLAGSPSPITSYKNRQQDCHFPSEESIETIKLNGSFEYYHNTASSAMHHVSVYYPSALCQYETPVEAKMSNCYPSTVPSERPIPPNRFQDSSTLHYYRPYVSILTKSCTIYQTSKTCGFSPAFSTSSPVHISYLATSFPSKTSKDLSSPRSVASSEASCNERTRHEKKVNGKRTVSRHQCSFCSKSYSTSSGLSNHQDLYHSTENVDSTVKKSFSCKYCKKIYVSSGGLKMHIRTHTLPCKCVICGKAFSRPWLLQGHIRTHTGEKPFSCPLCNRAFADRSNLRAHLQTHCEIKRHSCSNCGKSFSRMSLLTKHKDSGCSSLFESTEDHKTD